MQTEHKIFYDNANKMKEIQSGSIDMVVTSPPYPMIAMWDEMFSQQDSNINKEIEKQNGFSAFELMHKILDSVWNEVYRVLKKDGFVCINIGDATRNINGNFGLYPNHMRILKKMVTLGFMPLPCILWRKQTNTPNKFMGSGMLPSGAYVTLEHEYILLFRKNQKRVFKKEEEKRNRRESAIFWEERNIWYSDVWVDMKGTLQTLNNNNSRKRSAAYPFELVYRLINMYSVKQDVILDPFLGTGTTTEAAMACGRNSVGYEIDSSLSCTIEKNNNFIVELSKRLIRLRLTKHIEFILSRLKTKGKCKYINKYYGFPVITGQERELIINDPLEVRQSNKNVYKVLYEDAPQQEFINNWDVELQNNKLNIVEKICFN